jgi:SAM-dependent methyltransferase
MLPQRIVALDIDADMLAICKRKVDRLVENSEKYSAVNHNEEIQKTIAELPRYFQEAAKKGEGKYIIKAEKYLEILPEGLTVLQEFPRNLFLLNDNFLNLEAKPQYDTVICLGTVKWIHLAMGDTGLQAFFNKVHDFLKPGGHFALSLLPQEEGLQRALPGELQEQYEDRPHQLPLSPQLFRVLGRGRGGIERGPSAQAPLADLREEGVFREHVNVI